MKKKMIKIVVCTVIVSIAFSITTIVTAGDENNPEITDGEGDVFIARQNLLKILTAFQILDTESVDFLDIHAAWFYEDSAEPEHLFASIKLKDLELTNQRVIYAVYWTYGGFEMSAYVHVLSNGEHAIFAASNENWGATYKINGSFDTERNIVTFKISKTMVGDPQPGDTLVSPSAWAGLRLARESYLTAIIGELAKDYAPNGKDYVIQY